MTSDEYNTLDCLSCGVCCYFPNEIGKSFKGITVGEDGWCIYYDKEKKCTIHDKKPLVCIEFVAGSPHCLLSIEENSKIIKN